MKEAQFPLHNASQGGYAKTDHLVVLKALAVVMEAFSRLTKKLEGPGTLDKVMDHNPSMDALWLEDIIAGRPTTLQHSHVTWFSAQVERYLRLRCAVRLTLGYPVYARGGPGLCIVSPQLYEKFFEASFAVLLRED